MLELKKNKKSYFIKKFLTRRKKIKIYKKEKGVDNNLNRRKVLTKNYFRK